MAGRDRGRQFWFSVFNELKTRGVQDCFNACVDGLRGLPEAIEMVYPHTRIQLCVVHPVRNSLRYFTWKDCKLVAADLRVIYTALTLEAARAVLAALWPNSGGSGIRRLCRTGSETGGA